MYCRKCRYDLQRLEGPACPECGRAFDPRDPSTFDPVRSWPGACIGLLVAGLVLRAFTEWLVFGLGSGLPGLLYGGDWIALLVALLGAFAGGWCANMRVTFLVYGGLCAYMMVPGWFDHGGGGDSLLAAPPAAVLGGLVLATLVVTVSTWVAGRLGWRCRNALHRHRAGRHALRRWWRRPRTYVLVGAAGLLLSFGWVAVETLRVMYGEPNVAVDYDALIESRRAQMARAESPASTRRWRALMAALERLDLTVAELDAARQETGYDERMVWDDGMCEFTYVLYGPGLPPGSERERQAIEALARQRWPDQMRQAVSGPIALREVDLSDPFLTAILSYLTPARSAARVMVASMRFGAVDGDLEASADSFDAVMALAAAVSHQGSVIEDLTASAIVALATRELRNELQERHLDADTCRRLLATLDRHRLAPVQLALEADRAAFLDTIQRVFTDDGDGDGYWMPAAATLHFGVGPALGLWENLAGSFEGRFVQCSRSVLVDLYEETMQVYMARSQLPRHERWTGTEDVDRLIARIEADDLFLLQGLPSLRRFIDSRAATAQKLEATRVMIAIELFTATEGAPPASLDELAPRFLSHVPIDPLTGRPFGYVLLESDPYGRSYLLYGLGADGVDHGGRFDPNWPAWRNGTRGPGFDVPLSAPRETLE